MGAALRKCLFLDRDGIVNQSPGPGYVERWEDFHIIPGILDVLRLASERDYAAIVISNQRCVARGLVSLETIEDIHARMRRRFKDEHGVELLDVLFCPHDEGECDCRKPQPGMLLTAAARHGIDLRSSWMVGDQEGDVEAGRRAGCRTILVAPGEGETRADIRVAALHELGPLLDELL